KSCLDWLIFQHTTIEQAGVFRFVINVPSALLHCQVAKGIWRSNVLRDKTDKLQDPNFIGKSIDLSRKRWN
ncbi:hypothetical protein TorRG33x02_023350, partial [Trema orientale]